ncbi:DedA family protein [Paragemmobacter ruber]|uniref:DedA family protein n=1 Tax=Paragemmobacter ruber TaxID=1985673 RepID=A0ABW9Y8I0_9RHOB|nr:VTT domain-containing protein [Rhodobacter ruber]NBE08815.1 DedA family protein [Rhodobacter ruber]
MTQTLLALVPEWGAILLALANLLACLALPIPASLVMLAAGAFAAAGDLDALPLWIGAMAGALLGDQCGYWIGRGVGPRLLVRLSQRRRSAALLRRAVAWLEHRRLPAIFLSRWLASPLSPYMNFAAGAARINWLGFTLPAMAGASVWVSIYIGLGYSFSGDLEALGSVLGNLVAAIAAGVVAIVLWQLLGRNGDGLAEDDLPNDPASDPVTPPAAPASLDAAAPSAPSADRPAADRPPTIPPTTPP